MLFQVIAGQLQYNMFFSSETVGEYSFSSCIYLSLPVRTAVIPSPLYPLVSTLVIPPPCLLLVSSVVVLPLPPPPPPPYPLLVSSCSGTSSPSSSLPTTGQFCSGTSSSSSLPTAGQYHSGTSSSSYSLPTLLVSTIVVPPLPPPYPLLVSTIVVLPPHPWRCWSVP